MVMVIMVVIIMMRKTDEMVERMIEEAGRGDGQNERKNGERECKAHFAAEFCTSKIELATRKQQKVYKQSW